MLKLVPFASKNSMGAYDPFYDMDRFFSSNALNAFRTDVKDAGNAYEVEMDLPGFKKEDIHLDVENGFLKVSAERHSDAEKKDENGGLLHSERWFGSYSRSFDLSGVDESGVTASYDGGVLKLVLPKKAEEKPQSRRIEIG